jgi:hypothetical protein
MAKLVGQFAALAESQLSYGGNFARAQAATVEVTRCANVQARASDAFQKGMLTLDLRNSGKQVVTVQHLNVQDGGQAVMAGTVGRDREAGGKGDAG